MLTQRWFVSTLVVTLVTACSSERFVRGKPTSALPPEAAHINSITSEGSGSEDSAAVNFPTLSAAREALARANRY